MIVYEKDYTDDEVKQAIFSVIRAIKPILTLVLNEAASFIREETLFKLPCLTENEPS